MREWISWLNDEIVQFWPILLVLIPLVYGWRSKRDERKRAEMLGFVREAITLSANEAAAANSADISVIREQVTNDHDTNLRHDLTALHDDVRIALRVGEQHLDWSREWTERIDRLTDEHVERITAHDQTLADHAARILALETAAANPLPPAA